MTEQLALFPNRYARCQNCGRDVVRVQRTRRFWLCDACWAEIVPTFDGVVAEGSPEQEAVRKYWIWYREMEKRYPVKRPVRRRHGLPDDLSVDRYWPFCRNCGARVEECEYRNYVPQYSLFGGPRRPYCARCDARLAVESIFKMSRRPDWHPDWDAEDWLDLLYQSHPQAFAVGILPEYWFELVKCNLTA